MNATTEPQRYSRAFEVLVQGDADVAGLLAYALYKQAIREAATQGRAIHISEDRSPTATETRAYRDAADGMLSTFTESIIEQSKTDIIDTAIRADLHRVESNLGGLIQQATTWRTAIITNLVAWLLSIAITFLVVVAGVPGWITALIIRVKAHP